MNHSLLQTLSSMKAADVGRCFMLPIMFLFIALCAWLVGKLRVGPKKKPANAINSANYRPELHIHVIDFDRSRLLPNIDGSILAECCYQGCGCNVMIGKNVAGLIVGVGADERTELRRWAPFKPLAMTKGNNN